LTVNGAGFVLNTTDRLDLDTLGARLRGGEIRPVDVVAGVLERMRARGDDHVWIHKISQAEIEARAVELERHGPAGLALYGIPFAVKDNIDVAGLPTTAACPRYRYLARSTAPVVQSLLDAGAILIGKTNLDQFATGLVGTRSPHGACTNAFDSRYISGGSSAGSAVAVAAGLVSFALGTDTAGSGRVPAAFNNIVGLKPTRGLLSTTGVVPACRSLDCVSIFALCCADAADVFRIATRFDPTDPYARHAGHSTGPFALAQCRMGVPRPSELEFFGNSDAARLFDAARSRLVELGAVVVEVDFEPFFAAARMLYDGPWVAERFAAIKPFFEREPDALLPVIRKIIESGTRFSAADAFMAQYRLRHLARMAEAVWARTDVLLTPTAGTIYTIAEVNADPIRLNSNLGRYTNYVNLMDLAAIAVPAGFQDDGLPFGISLAAPAFRDASLCRLGDTIHRSLAGTCGATGLALPGRRVPVPGPGGSVLIAVCGAHMSGLPLNHQLLERGAHLVRACKTAARYKLFALTNFSPPRPGLVRFDTGHTIEVELWAMPVEAFGGFVDTIPAPLGIGTVELESGEAVRGFLCEAHATAHAPDISTLGGWRPYIANHDKN
jgi:allophanate hydrolase